MAQKREIIYDLTQSFGVLPEYLIKRIDFLSKLLEEIPEEYRETATIYQEAGESQEGWPFLEYRISYWRQETEEEVRSNRIMKESARLDAVIKERDKLAELMLKYPGDVTNNLKKEK